MSRYEYLLDTVWLSILVIITSTRDTMAQTIVPVVFLPAAIWIACYIPKKLKGDRRINWFCITFFSLAYLMSVVLAITNLNTIL